MLREGRAVGKRTTLERCDSPELRVCFPDCAREQGERERGGGGAFQSRSTIATTVLPDGAIIIVLIPYAPTNNTGAIAATSTNYSNTLLPPW